MIASYHFNYLSYFILATVIILKTFMHALFLFLIIFIASINYTYTGIIYIKLIAYPHFKN